MMHHTDREAMQKALEALENSRPIDQSSASPHNKHIAAIKALRERLAQPGQEPVAWRHESTGRLSATVLVSKFSEWEPLYTTPPRREWVGLTEEEMIDLQDRCGISIHLADFQAIEANLREKNA